MSTTTSTRIDLDTIKLDLYPMMPMRDEIKFNKLNVFAGKNGSGKTVILKGAFALSYVGNTYCLLKNTVGMTMQDYELRELVDFAFSNTFGDFNSSGECYATYTNGSKVTVKFTLGKCTFAEVITISTDNIPAVTYASSSMRLFSAYDTYLKFRAMISKNTRLTSDELAKMLNSFKLYEVVLAETLIGKSPIDMSFATSLWEKPYNIKPITYIEVDLDKSEVIARYPDGSIVKLSTLSAGEQAVINMFMLSNKF